ncbi:MAG: class I SAM-dependent methyltransferase [Desulfatitalea sp.]|nr:class I SAM-dependent methyltransferase [Desulfatitalea sp.]NNJ99012.1 class I SAM-dependent methyltransferase [Desulfatitalea sp.]
MTNRINLYESAALREVTGAVIRPGGLALTERALEVCKLSAGARVLDVGCGSGVTVMHLRQCHELKAVGLDLCWPLLREGRHQAGPTPLIQGRAQALPLGDGGQAAIFCECVLSLLAAPEIALAEWHRVLVLGGFLAITDLYTRSGPTKTPSAAPSRCCIAGAVDRKTLLQRIVAAGFEVLLFEDHTPLLKQLAAQLVWTHGSLESFWAKTGTICGAFESPKPGYYLLVAEKCEAKSDFRHRPLPPGNRCNRETPWMS